MTLTARAIALLLGTGLCLSACAQPGQLGHPLPAPPAPAAAPAAPAAPTPAAGKPTPASAVPAEPVSGRLDARVTIRTPGPSVYSVRAVVLAPGQSLGWKRHPGTTMAVVRTGAVTLVRQGACDPVGYTHGQALVIGDGVAHRLVNTGTAPAELLVTMILAPDVPETTDAPPACK